MTMLKVIGFYLIVALVAYGLFLYWVRRKQTKTYYTIDGHRLAPYPNMTDEELEDFEDWADKQ